MNKDKPIDEMTELVPGMLIKGKEESYRVVFAQPFRDALAVCLDDCGHTKLVPAWNGEYVIVTERHEKMRIAYGKTSEDKIEVSEEYYWSDQDFKDKHPQTHFWYVEELRGTRKYVEDKSFGEKLKGENP